MSKFNKKWVRAHWKTGAHVPKVETVADFTKRIARMMRERETGKKYSLIGASRAADAVLRKPRGK